MRNCFSFVFYVSDDIKSQPPSSNSTRVDHQRKKHPILAGYSHCRFHSLFVQTFLFLETFNTSYPLSQQGPFPSPLRPVIILWYSLSFDLNTTVGRVSISRKVIERPYLNYLCKTYSTTSV